MAPIALLVLQEKEIDFGFIPALVMDIYTVYKVTFIIINLKKSINSSNILLRQLKIIALIDAIVLILTL